MISKGHASLFSEPDKHELDTVFWTASSGQHVGAEASQAQEARAGVQRGFEPGREDAGVVALLSTWHQLLTFSRIFQMGWFLGGIPGFRFWMGGREEEKNLAKEFERLFVRPHRSGGTK